MAGRQTPEHRLQVAVAQHLRLRARRDVFWCSIPNEGPRSARYGSWLVQAGLRAGCPDMLIIISGKAHGLELKAGRNKQTVQQIACEYDWKQAGGSYAVATGIDEALAVLSSWGAFRDSPMTPSTVPFLVGEEV